MQINRVRLPAMLFSVSLYRFFSLFVSCAEFYFGKGISKALDLHNNNNNICLFPPFADFSELQVGSGKALTNIQLYI